MTRHACIAHQSKLKDALLFILLALIALPSIAFTQADLPVKAPQLVSGQWTAVDGKKTFLARILVADASHDAALARGLGFALEQAFGTLILNEIEVKNGEVTMQNTLSYRSAFIQQFKILEQRSEEGRIALLLDVWVQESQLSDRVLGKSTATATVDWQTLNEQVLSFLQSRQSADQVLESVLRDFPYRAFQITMERSEVVVDDRRVPSLRMPFRLEWDRNFLISIEEALVRISHNPKCDAWLQRDTYVCQKMFQVATSRQTAYFDDKLVMELLRKHMELDPPIVRLNVLDSEGTSIHSACFYVTGLGSYQWAQQKLYEISHRSYLQERLRISAHISVPLSSFKGSVSKLSLDVIRRSKCPELQK